MIIIIIIIVIIIVIYYSPAMMLDTIVLLANVQPVSNLFDLLSLFEKCSGLTRNQAKLEKLLLGS